jgi:hypothetical protein
VNAIPFVDEVSLVALVQNPATTVHAWTDRAACVECDVDPEAYFPEDTEPPPADALACCAACPVSQQCLASALVHESLDGYRFGWWGGFGPAERDALWRRLDVAPLQPANVSLWTTAEIARYMRDEDYTVPAIAAELGCTERSVYRYLAASAA